MMMNRARSGFIHIVGPALRNRAPQLLCWWHLLAMIVLQVENAVYYGSAPPRQTFSSSSCFIRRLFMHVLCGERRIFLAVAAGAFISGINFFCVCEQVADTIPASFHGRAGFKRTRLRYTLVVFSF